MSPKKDLWEDGDRMDADKIKSPSKTRKSKKKPSKPKSKPKLPKRKYIQLSVPMATYELWVDSDNQYKTDILRAKVGEILGLL